MQEHLASLAAQGDAADTLIILEVRTNFSILCATPSVWCERFKRSLFFT